MIIHTKFQDHGSIGSGEEDFLRFLPYMGMAAMWSCDPTHLYRFSFLFSLKLSYEYWFQIAQLFLIWAWRPYWSCNPDHLSNFSFLKAQEAVYEIWLQSAQQFQRRSRLTLWMTTETAYTISSPVAFGSGELKNN